MRPTKRDQDGQQDLLRSRLDQIVDLAHPLAKLARSIDWSFLEQQLGAVYTDRPGRPPLRGQHSRLGPGAPGRRIRVQAARIGEARRR